MITYLRQETLLPIAFTVCLINQNWRHRKRLFFCLWCSPKTLLVFFWWNVSLTTCQLEHDWERHLAFSLQMHHYFHWALQTDVWDPLFLWRMFLLALTWSASAGSCVTAWYYLSEKVSVMCVFGGVGGQMLLLDLLCVWRFKIPGLRCVEPCFTQRNICFVQSNRTASAI